MTGRDLEREPDHTAVRVALWRALHLEVDAPPHLLEDTVGLAIVDPPDDWRQRGDMHPEGTRGFRAAIVGRARLVEDLVIEHAAAGVSQYVILGAGLDTFAQRRPEIASRLHIFEVDQPGPQAWKRDRLIEIGLGIPEQLSLVAMDFESGWSWDPLVEAGFDLAIPSIVSSIGVSMYLTEGAIRETLQRVAALASGSTLAMTFLLPPELLDEEDRALLEFAVRGAAAAGTPFLSFFSPSEIDELLRAAGFAKIQQASSVDLERRYFTGRPDHLRPASGEVIIVAGN